MANTLKRRRVADIKSRITKLKAQVPARAVMRAVDEQDLLEEMAAIFFRLEHIKQWPTAVIMHCSAWAAVMSAELPATTKNAEQGGGGHNSVTNSPNR